MDEIEDAYNSLCAAVVEQAVKDYIKAVRYLQRKRHRKRMRDGYIDLYNDAREFLLDEKRHSLYTDIDGEAILEEVNRRLGWKRGKMRYD